MAQFASIEILKTVFFLYLSIDTVTPLCCRFLQAGGSPEKVVELLSDNYTAVAQTVNLLAEWMIQAGVDIKDVQEMVENHLKEMILKTFDPKKADSIFSDEGEVYIGDLWTEICPWYSSSTQLDVYIPVPLLSNR